jgi:hypothetical protein
VATVSAKSAPLTCGYPGCTRPILRTGGPGRPAEYCDLPEHTRWRAWRERQRIKDDEGNTPAGNVTVTKPGWGRRRRLGNGQAN